MASAETAVAVEIRAAGETFFVFNFLLFVFITRGHMKMYLMAARPWICIFRRAKEAANVRLLHVT